MQPQKQHIKFPLDVKTMFSLNSNGNLSNPGFCRIVHYWRSSLAVGLLHQNVLPNQKYFQKKKMFMQYRGESSISPWLKTSSNPPPQSGSNLPPPTPRTSSNMVSALMSGWMAVSCPPRRSCVMPGWHRKKKKKKKRAEGLPPSLHTQATICSETLPVGDSASPSQLPMELSVHLPRLLLTCYLL